MKEVRELLEKAKNMVSACGYKCGKARPLIDRALTLLCSQPEQNQPNKRLKEALRQSSLAAKDFCQQPSAGELSKTAREYLDKDSKGPRYLKNWLRNWCYEACDHLDRQAAELKDKDAEIERLKGD